MNKFIVLFFVFITFISTTYAINYADIEINVEKDGTTSIRGTTNYDDFKEITNSHKFTSKDGEYWVFNLSTQEQFDEYIFKLNLPKNAQINYVKVPGSFRIEDNAGRISIIGFGEDEFLNVIVQYKINYIKSFLNKDTTILVLSGLLVFMIIFSTILLFKINDLKKRKRLSKISKDSNTEKSYDITLFTPRQQEIIKYLESNKRLTQKELEDKMNIPKSSVSRNIRTLEIKGILTKERVGHTNYLSLKNL